MKVTILPSRIQGSVWANASKSSMQRACAAALLCQRPVLLRNPGTSNDDLAAMDIIVRLGARLERSEEGLQVSSSGVVPVSDAIHCGESGLSIRMFTPIAALSSTPLTVMGNGSLVTRPMDFFDEVLPRLQVITTSEKGRLPLKIEGPLVPADIEIDGSLSSQFLTGLLMAYSASGAKGVSIKVNDLKSKPYIDLTLEVMKRFGMQVPENRSYQEFFFTGELPSLTERVDYTVEGDWSGASFLLVAGAIAGGIMVKGLDPFSTQADKKILEALMDAGAVMSVTESHIDIAPAVLQPFHFDATECPDLFPPLVALAAHCQGPSVIVGTNRLTHKESNRALTLQDEFGKMGISIELQDNLMIVNGGTGVKPAVVHSRHDHRIAMSCAVAALKAEGAVEIEEAEAINKSYPSFFEHLRQLGAQVLYN